MYEHQGSLSKLELYSWHPFPPICVKLCKISSHAWGANAIVDSKRQLSSIQIVYPLFPWQILDTHQGDDDVSIQQFDNNIFYDVVGGMNSKGRMFGLGSEIGKYKSSSSSMSSNGISLSEYDQMRSLVSKVIEEKKNLKEQ
ncbi:hypothetical protein E2542_SST12813 [Spatholobus suberectus]|nr:hypothetical protein E2542_SST12813 [Spatholobus suberectus]